MNTLLVLLAAGGVAILVAPYLRRESPVVRSAVIVFSLCMTARYVFWRTTATLPEWKLTTHSVLGYGFYVLEMIAVYLAIKELLLLKRTTNRSADVERQLEWYGASAPRVDVLIATYNESWEVLEKTVVGATSQNYPNYKVWILDDGNRAWLREKAGECGLGYVTRSNNQHYKAGNLNNGIAHIRACGVEPEFLALLDADFIARPEFLRRTAALMKTEDVGIVQTPQCFYNPDPHQQAYGGVHAWPDEQRSWFDVYLPALDALGWASCCGTSCLIRARALDAIGGFPTESVCEDTLSSIKMRRKGFKTIYLHEPLTVGLAPEGIIEFLTQRARWLVGGVQNTRASGAQPGVRGRLLYWLGLWRMAIFGVMRPAWMTMCVAYWFTGVFLIPAMDFYDALSFFGPLWLDRLFQGWLFSGTRLVFVADSIWTLLAPLWIRETYRAVVGSKARFKVTDKAVHRDRTVVHWQLLWFHGPMFVLLSTGLVYTLVDPTAPGHHAGFFQANTALTLYFMLVIVAGVAPIVERPKRRTADRYRTSERVTAIVDGKPLVWQCRDLSVGGALVHTHGDAPLPPVLDLELEGIGLVRGALVRSDARGLAAFAFQTPEARPDLIRKLYCTERYIPRETRWGLGRTLSSFFRHLVW